MFMASSWVIVGCLFHHLIKSDMIEGADCVIVVVDHYLTSSTWATLNFVNQILLLNYLVEFLGVFLAWISSIYTFFFSLPIFVSLSSIRNWSFCWTKLRCLRNKCNIFMLYFTIVNMTYYNWCIINFALMMNPNITDVALIITIDRSSIKYMSN